MRNYFLLQWCSWIFFCFVLLLSLLACMHTHICVCMWPPLCVHIMRERWAHTKASSLQRRRRRRSIFLSVLVISSEPLPCFILFSLSGPSFLVLSLSLSLSFSLSLFLSLSLSLSHNPSLFLKSKKKHTCDRWRFTTGATGCSTGRRWKP